MNLHKGISPLAYLPLQRVNLALKVQLKVQLMETVKVYQYKAKGHGKVQLKRTVTRKSLVLH